MLNRNITLEKYYSIAIRRRTDNDDRFYHHKDFTFNEIKLNCGNRFWLADPFLFENKGETYVFYELFDIISGKGVIAYSVLQDDNMLSKPKVVIRERWHLSFPYIFTKNNCIYIMPESSGKEKVYLYRAVDFPDKWVYDRDVLIDEFAVDTIWIDENTTNKLIASVQYHTPPNGKVISCWVKNKLYYIDESKNSKELQEGEYGVRNAGKTFLDYGNCIRPGQNCENGKYGKGLVFWKMHDDLSEEEIYHIDYDRMGEHILNVNCEKGREIVGVHTYNSTDKYEVIDFAYYQQLPFLLFYLKKAYRLSIRCIFAIKRLCIKNIKGKKGV